MIISRSVHVAANGIISFFFMAEKYPSVCVCVWYIYHTHIYSTHTYIYTPHSFLKFFLATLCGMWDLSSLTRAQTCTPCSESMES